MTTKNSCARNLSRLLSGVAFISSLLQRLAADPAVSLRCAAMSFDVGGFTVQGPTLISWGWEYFKVGGCAREGRLA